LLLAPEEFSGAGKPLTESEITWLAAANLASGENA
jgi:hypothetical protein